MRYRTLTAIASMSVLFIGGFIWARNLWLKRQTSFSHDVSTSQDPLISILPTLTIHTQKLIPTVSQIVYPTAVLTVSPTPFPISQWKTYTNTTYGFSFKHPNLASKTDFSNSSLSGPISATYIPIILFWDERSVSAEGSDAPFDAFQIFTEQNPENKSFEAYIEGQKNKLYEEMKGLDGYETYEIYLASSESSLEVDGVQGIALKGIWRPKIIYIPFPGRREILVITKTDRIQDRSFEPTLRQILSTFKFTR